jgi:hypothetical protein
VAIAHVFQRNEQITWLQRARVDRDTVYVPLVAIDEFTTGGARGLFGGPEI